MQPKSLGQYNWLLDAIEAERASFDDEKVPLLSCHAAALKTAIDLLLEDEVSLEKRSKQRRCERLKARTLLVDIYTGVSPEVFMLCIFATTITKLEKVPPKVAVPKLRALSKTKPLPKGLIETTMELCNAYSIDALISSHKADISCLSTIRPGSLPRHRAQECPTENVEPTNTQLLNEDLMSKVLPDGAVQNYARSGVAELLTGKVYKLTREDTVAAIMDDGTGDYWLTVPFGTESSPFITFRTTQKLGMRFTRQRPRMM
ncbi:hypothetical protein T440DRAFT_559887 [Plenodomus tracheiphilus IPT5]|uniref:Uncharacterized protein n=1 Tax=Plenodomus tracheiphilus IPT5 TaxID=1408161 RepID=A0A6A7ALT4_9PLEO|nr:hypothetical protein T440DRAFT_559887 [Plenodomus tracheiphilus IPT5]